MLHELINHSEDLKKLLNEGYELCIIDGCAVVSHIPYITSQKEIKYGIIISPLELSGNKTKKPENHVIHFSGEYPCDKNGNKITSIEHATITKKYGGITCNYSFSNKPVGGYNDYYEKFTNYINIISSHAISLNDKVTPNTFMLPTSYDSGVFEYYDTNSSRAGISEINKKVLNEKIGIVGLGGTGSYILDLIAKTEVKEIHLFDGDKFYSHNAFRAPGAPTKSTLNKQKYKTNYFKNIYKNMHKGIKSHNQFITKNNVERFLKTLNFVFICIDNGETKKIIINTLNKYNIKYIDCGIDVNIVENSLIGSIKNTLITNSENDKLVNRISFEENEENNNYASNIQIAELNAISANFAVIAWKKLNGIYLDNTFKHNLVYDTNDGEIKYED